MAQPQTGSRSYRSDLRARQAERTRAEVAAAARRLFQRHGFAATTIAAIAVEAGVSPQTVYASFGSKVAVLRAILEQMEESAEAAQWRERIAAADDPHQILAAFAHWTRAFFEASSPSFAIAQEAAAELTDLAEEGARHRRAALESIIGRLAQQNALRPGVAAAKAVDRAWLLTGVQTYLMATSGCGWTPAEYSGWLATTLAEQILKPDSD